MFKNLRSRCVGLLLLILIIPVFSVLTVVADDTGVTVETDKENATVKVDISDAALGNEDVSVVCYSPDWDGELSDENLEEAVYLNQYSLQAGLKSFDFKINKAPTEGTYTLVIGTSEGIIRQTFVMDDDELPPDLDDPKDPEDPKEVKVTVTFDPNGGTVSRKEIEVIVGKTIAAALPTPTRTGYGFEGWYTAKTGGTPFTSATKVTGKVTVYARWKDLSPAAGTQFNSGKLKYKVVKKAAVNAKGVVQVIGAKAAGKKLQKVTIPLTVKSGIYTYNVESIKNNAFKGFQKLRNVTIGGNVKTIGNSAFSGCIKLKTVKIGKNVAKIGKKVFYNAKALRTVTVQSKKLTSVGKNTFKKINSKAVIKVPKAKLGKYKSLLKKGQKKSVVIKKS